MEPNLSSDNHLTQSSTGSTGATGVPGTPGFDTASSANALGGHCQPLECDKAMGCIDGARNPSTTSLQLGEFRGQLQDCAPCLQAFDLEVKLRSTMAPTMSDLPSPDLAMRITQTLASVDLSQLDISDF